MENKYCIEQLIFHGERLNHDETPWVQFRLGFFMDEQDIGNCCCPGTSMGIGLMGIASGVDSFDGNDIFVPAKVWILPYERNPFEKSIIFSFFPFFRAYHAGKVILKVGGVFQKLTTFDNFLPIRS